MENLFLEYFHHGVKIDMIKFDFDETEEGNHKIAITLSSYIKDENNSRKTTCVFNNLCHSSLSIMPNFVSGITILDAYMDNNDECMLEYKNEQKNFLSSRALSSLNCYVLLTDCGSIKIILTKGIQVQE